MNDLMTRQAELEYEAVMLGQRRYDEMRSRSESGTTACQRVTEDALPMLAQAIHEFIEKSATSGGRWHAAVKYLAHVLPEQAAYLTIRYAIDGAAARQKVNTVAIAIGTAIEDHLNVVALKDSAPGLYRKVIEQIRKSTSERHKVGVLRHVVKKYTAESLSWSVTDKLHLGMKLIELFSEKCNIVDLQRDTEGHHNTPVKVVFTAEAQTALEGAHKAWRDLHPVHLPMLVPPRAWRTEERILEDGTAKRWISGGYTTRAIRRAGMVQSRLPGALQRLVSGDISNVYRAVNAIQSTPWRINRSILKVMQEVRDGGAKFKRLLVEEDQPMPGRPAELADVAEDVDLSDNPSLNEVLKVYKRSKALVHEHNAKLRSKRVSCAQKLWVAEKFSEEVAIYFPHYLDFRGRIYPYASYLNPQSSDDGRALLEFAEGRPLGERGLYWLKVHLANLFGIDKVSFEERVKWTNDNLEKLLDSASAPLDGHMFWTTADSPWSALAACFEMAGALVDGEAHASHLPIAMDGTCSGLQHYSAMLRDPVGGRAVNLVPVEKPGDIYTQVAKRAQALSDSSTHEMVPAWKDKVVRKVAKQPTMTLCYSATVYGMQGQIANAVNGLGGSAYLNGADVKQASIYMAHIVWDAIGDVVVAARSAMEFLKHCSDLMAERELAVCWTAPSGFRVEQGYRKVTGKRVMLNYKGTPMMLSVAEETEKLDPKKQSAGVAPNFVHSLDSAHLMATVNLGIDNELDHWACIHDSFGVHAADVDVLHACIREAFIEQYTPNVLEHFREEIVDQLPEELHEKVPQVPPMGTLDLAAVRSASYFFA